MSNTKKRRWIASPVSSVVGSLITENGRNVVAVMPQATAEETRRIAALVADAPETAERVAELEQEKALAIAQLEKHAEGLSRKVSQWQERARQMESDAAGMRSLLLGIWAALDADEPSPGRNYTLRLFDRNEDARLQAEIIVLRAERRRNKQAEKQS